MDLRRELTVPRPIDEVFAYLADFTTTNEWDPGTVKTTRESGDGGVGTRYHNVSRFLGRTTELVYETTEHEPPRQIRLRGENSTVVAHDTMTLTPAGDSGTHIVYEARFDFKGLARLVAPLTAPAFNRLADKGAEGMRAALGGRAG